MTNTAAGVKDGSLKKFYKHIGKVGRSSEDSLAYGRQFVVQLVRALTKRSVAYAENARRTTLKFRDLEAAAESLDLKVYGDDHLEVSRANPKTGKFRSAKTADGKPSRHSAGNAPVYLSPTAIRRIAQEEAGGKIRMTSGFIGALQVLVETQLKMVLKAAQTLAFDVAGRQGIQGGDVKLAIEASCVHKKM